jgi:hypothetical protein
MRYWERHWIVQELVLSESRILVYGKSTISWDKFVSGLDALSYIINLDTYRFRTRLLDLVEMFTASTANPHDTESGTVQTDAAQTGIQTTWIDAEVWLRCIELSQSTLCQDLRDKVYGIQSLFNPQVRIEANYSLSVQDVYVKAVVSFAKCFANVEDFAYGCIALAEGMGLHFDVQLRDAIRECSRTADSRAQEQNDAKLHQILKVYLIDYNPS